MVESKPREALSASVPSTSHTTTRMCASDDKDDDDGCVRAFDGAAFVMVVDARIDAARGMRRVERVMVCGCNVVYYFFFDDFGFVDVDDFFSSFGDGRSFFTTSRTVFITSSYA